MIDSSLRKCHVAAHLPATTAVLTLIILASAASARPLAGQTISPPALDSSSPWSPLDSVLPEVSEPTLKTPAQMEIEQEQLVLHQEQLSDNREDLQNAEPAVAHMNQSALSVQTESIRNSRTSGSLEVSGGYLNNLYDRSSDKIASEFSRYSLPVAFSTSGPRVLFHASYLPELTLYSAAADLYQSHAYEHTLLYSLSGRTTVSWQLAAAHFHDVGQFLPTVLAIGGTGIAQPVGTASNVAGVSSISNAATSLALQHRVSPRDEFTYTGTAAWNELLQLTSPPQPGAHQVLRNEPFAADVLYEHALTPRTFLGAEETLAYVRGLSTLTRLTYETSLATLRYTPAQNDSFAFAAGPMILQRSGPPSIIPADSVTYALNANYVHRSSIATISANYARIVQLSIDNTALPANQFSGVFVRPVTRHIDFTADARYIRAQSATPYPVETSIGGAVRLDYSTGTRLGWFLSASSTYASQPTISTVPSTFNRTEISGGLRLILDGRPSR